VSDTSLDACDHFVEHGLAAQPAVHRLGRVKATGLEQLVRRCAAAAPAEIAASAFARADTASDLGADRTEQIGVLDVREPILGDVTESKTTEAGMTGA
jgi:hypothetical protein